MAQVTTFTGRGFKNEIKKSGLPVLVAFLTGGSGAEITAKPLIEELADKLDGFIKFVTVRLFNDMDLRREYNTLGHSAFVLFRDGKEDWRTEGQESLILSLIYECEKRPGYLPVADWLRNKLPPKPELPRKVDLGKQSAAADPAL